MKYRVDFYDAFDGWSGTGEHYTETEVELLEYDDLKVAIAKAEELQATLEDNNKKMGEHWGVIDLTKNIEIFCQMQKHGLI